jgi:LmbE family N-acetylglucosaminyl deacetylase
MKTLQRVLIVAPHPDDESLAAGGLIQRVTAAGGSVRVLFVTEGENNPWPQRLLHRRWFIGDEDRKRWGTLRRAEAERSLARLGVAATATDRLGLPDHGLLGLARSNDPRLGQALARAVAEYAPTLVVSPSAFDLHDDHRTVSWSLHTILRDTGVPVVTYIIHGSAAPSRLEHTLHLTTQERLHKEAAIRCHETQLLLSERRFLSYATAVERFYRDEYDCPALESPWTTLANRLRHAALVLREGLASAPASGRASPLAGTPAATAQKP